MRETKKFKTKFGTEIEILTYLTGGESRQIQDIFLENAKVGVEADLKTIKSPEIDASLISKAQDKTIEILVVSVNGSKEDILKTVLDLRKDDFDEIIKEIDSLSNPIPEEKKTK